MWCAKNTILSLYIIVIELYVVDPAKRGILILVSETPHYTNNSSYYFSLSFVSTRSCAISRGCSFNRPAVMICGVVFQSLGNAGGAIQEFHDELAQKGKDIVTAVNHCLNNPALPHKITSAAMMVRACFIAVLLLYLSHVGSMEKSQRLRL